MGGAQIRSMLLWVLLFLAAYAYLADGVFPEEVRQLRDEAREMFYHAFNGYMDHAFPLDELRPLSCAGEDTLGGYALTLVPIPIQSLIKFLIISLLFIIRILILMYSSYQIDSLDTLALLGDRQRFATSVEWLGKNIRFDIVSIHSIQSKVKLFFFRQMLTCAIALKVFI